MEDGRTAQLFEMAKMGIQFIPSVRQDKWLMRIPQMLHVWHAHTQCKAPEPYKNRKILLIYYVYI